MSAMNDIAIISREEWLYRMFDKDRRVKEVSHMLNASRPVPKQRSNDHMERISGVKFSRSCHWRVRPHYELQGGLNNQIMTLSSSSSHGLGELSLQQQWFLIQELSLPAGAADSANCSSRLAANRVSALSVGRGAFTLGAPIDCATTLRLAEVQEFAPTFVSSELKQQPCDAGALKPLPTELLLAPPLMLSGRFPPQNAVISLDVHHHNPDCT
eukprot:5031923-Amphidinium_carterae.1